MYYYQKILQVVSLSFLLIVFVFISVSRSSTDLDKALLFINQLMDKYHSSFQVYTEANSGGNHYIPSGWMGDISGVDFSSYEMNFIHSGLTSLRISYMPTGSKDFAGIYWQYPENNWGDKGPGLDLSGATELTFWVKGLQGGEWVNFFIGGINRPPFHKYDFPYQDSIGPLSTGSVQLTTDWQKFTISLNKDYFDIYRDFHYTYFPSGWMGDISVIEFDPDWAFSPFQGRKCIKLSFNWNHPKQWAGIYWQSPPNNWGNFAGGYNLSAFEKLTFWARGEHGGEVVIVKIGGILGPFGDSLYPALEKKIVLTTEWKQYILDLSGADLSHIIGGFCVVSNDDMCPGNCTLYLDDIRFERDISPEDLRGVIGGFGLSFEAEANPNGITVFIDDIVYNKSSLDKPRFVKSFLIEDPLKEAALSNVAFTYDNALAMLVYLSRNRPEDILRAKLIGDALAYAQFHDPEFSDGRLRNAYRAGELFDYATGEVLLPGWWDEEKSQWLTDSFCLAQHTGNMAWTLIAWLRYFEITDDDRFIENSIKLAQWLLDNTKDLRGDGGFTGGECPERVRMGLEQASSDSLCWKSTEHNLDLYVAFEKLYQVTGEEKWHEASLYAKKFVLSMWDNKDSHFWTGTELDGETINASVIPTDVQTWGLLALRDENLNGMPWAEKNTLFCPEGALYCGFDFNSNKDGVWFEGTAQAVLAYKFLDENQKADYYLSQIEKAQAELGQDLGGIVAAWSLDGSGVDTGFEWNYFQRLHLGATAWYIFAKEGYNPYWGNFFRQIGDVSGDGQIDIIDALFVARYVIGFLVENFVSEAADINCDKQINIIDALLIAKKALGLKVSETCD